MCVRMCVFNAICHVSLMFAFYSLILWTEPTGALKRNSFLWSLVSYLDFIDSEKAYSTNVYSSNIPDSL